MTRDQDRLRLRMHEVSESVKTLKQRFPQRFDRQRERAGTLWERRFKSILAEGCEDALGVCAASTSRVSVACARVKWRSHAHGPK